MTDASKPGLHPLVAAAAVAVIVLSGVGVAKMMNWLPDSASQVAATSTTPETKLAETQSAETAKPVEASKTKNPHITSKPHPQAPRHHASGQTAYAPDAAVASCGRCGVVTNVRTVAVAGQGSGLGAVAGAIVGGVIGHQFGGGNGNTAATAAGALGGGYVGNMIEGKERSSAHYEVSVRFNDGASETFSYAQDPHISAGTPVREENGQLIRR